MGQETKRYCALVTLNQESDMQRISRDVPLIIQSIKQTSTGEFEQLCRSNDGLLFGFFMKSSKPTPVIRASFESCTGTRQGDSFIVFEIGEDFNGIGFSRAWTWLQRH